LLNVLLIGFGGFAGAIARYMVDSVASNRTPDGFPWGTFIVNVSGSFALGVLATLIVERSAFPADLRGPLVIGFIGAYTTFSTLMLESWRLVEQGAWVYVALNLVGSVVLGIMAVVAGLAVGRAL